jgi:hypothetical protein
MKFSLAALAALPLLSSAILITSPNNSSTLTKGEDATITWTSVDTDDTSFGLVLVNFVYWPPYYQQLAEDVSTSANSTTVTIPCDLVATDGYQFNAINGTNLYVIYAQSSKFAIGGEDCEDSGNGDEPTCSASKVTVTITVAPTPTGKDHRHHHKSQGRVPKTIGWHGDDKGGYGYPVTLKTIPTATPTEKPQGGKYPPGPPNDYHRPGHRL